MKYKLGRTSANLFYTGFYGTYEGGNSSYYGVRAQFTDKDGNHLHWDTTFKGTGLLEKLKTQQWYELRFTVDYVEDGRSSIKRVTLVK